MNCIVIWIISQWRKATIGTGKILMSARFWWLGSEWLQKDNGGNVLGSIVYSVGVVNTWFCAFVTIHRAVYQKYWMQKCVNWYMQTITKK